MDEIVKICRKHGELNASQSINTPRKLKNNIIKYYFRCKKCVYACNAKTSYEWKKRNPEAYKKKHDICRKRYIKELHNDYLKKLLVRGSSLSFKDITPEMIELKRVQIKLKRFYKEFKNGNYQYQ